MTPTYVRWVQVQGESLAPSSMLELQICLLWKKIHASSLGSRYAIILRVLHGCSKVFFFIQPHLPLAEWLISIYICWCRCLSTLFQFNFSSTAAVWGSARQAEDCPRWHPHLQNGSWIPNAHLKGMGSRWEQGIRFRKQMKWKWLKYIYTYKYVGLHRPTKPSRHRESAIQRLHPPHHQVAGKCCKQDRALRLWTHSAHAHFPERGCRGGWVQALIDDCQKKWKILF